MKTRSISMMVLLLLALAGLACSVHVAPPPSGQRPEPAATPPPPPAPSHPITLDMSLFYDELSPYGDWYWLEPYGWVWSPDSVSVRWRPYTLGRWVYTDYGWTWDSEEEWGWAVFHYGRWLDLPYHGWVWVPGSDWGPAWVAWRYGGGWIAWAPLPPPAFWRPEVGLEIGIGDLDMMIQPSGWIFLEPKFFFEPAVYRYVVPNPRNLTLIKVTKNVTKIRIDQDRVFNEGVDVDLIQRETGGRATRLHIADSAAPPRHGATPRTDKDLPLYRPPISKGNPRHEPADRTKWVLAPAQAPTGREQQGDECRRPERPPQAATPPRPTTDRTPVTPAPPSSDSSPQLPQREQEIKQLEKDQADERMWLRRAHEKETAQPPAGMTKNDLATRQQVELKALDEKQKRERELLQKKQERARPDKGKK